MSTIFLHRISEKFCGWDCGRCRHTPPSVPFIPPSPNLFYLFQFRPLYPCPCSSYLLFTSIDSIHPTSITSILSFPSIAVSFHPLCLSHLQSLDPSPFRSLPLLLSIPSIHPFTFLLSNPIPFLLSPPLPFLHPFPFPSFHSSHFRYLYPSHLCSSLLLFPFMCHFSSMGELGPGGGWRGSKDRLVWSGL